MKNYKLLLGGLLCLLLTSCNNDSEPNISRGQEDENQANRTVLMYAIVAYDLSNFFEEELEHVIQANYSDLPENANLLIYSVQQDEKTGRAATPILRKLVKTENGSSLETLKVYGEESEDPGGEQQPGTSVLSETTINNDLQFIPSASSERVREVINDMMAFAPAKAYDMVYYGASNSWLPSEINIEDLSRSPQFRSIGYESNGYDKYLFDISEFADAIPNGLFDNIWFESSYMSNIETIYEFTGKCKYYIASPLEYSVFGMCYADMIPFALEGRWHEVAEGLVKFYEARNIPYALSIIDMKYIPTVSSAAREVFENYSTSNLPDLSTLQYYSRMKEDKLYDFEQVYREVALKTGANITPLHNALEKFVVFSACSNNDFNRNSIDKDNYSGISCHIYRDNGSVIEEAYKRTKWFKDIYPNGMK